MTAKWITVLVGKWYMYSKHINITCSFKEKIPGIRLVAQEQCAALIIQILYTFTAHSFYLLHYNYIQDKGVPLLPTNYIFNRSGGMTPLYDNTPLPRDLAPIKPYLQKIMAFTNLHILLC